MTKPLSEDSNHFIIFAWGKEGIHAYHLRANTPDKNRARIKFELLAESEGWKPFDRIDVYRLTTDEELESLLEIGPEDFR